jgi:hypothetical protein
MLAQWREGPWLVTRGVLACYPPAFEGNRSVSSTSLLLGLPFRSRGAKFPTLSTTSTELASAGATPETART